MDYMNMFQGGGHQAGYFVPQYNAMGQAAPHQHQERHQAQQRQQHGYPSYPYTNEHLMVLAQMQHQRTMMGQVHDASLSPTSKQDQPKPRLSKDEVDLLEKEFQKNHKPTSARKREIAELLKVDLPRINVSGLGFFFLLFFFLHGYYMCTSPILPMYLETLSATVRTVANQS